MPAVDVYEDTQKVVLKLEVPGIKQEDLDVRVENQTLTVKGERKFERDEKERTFTGLSGGLGVSCGALRCRRRWNTGAVTAGYDAGVLTISIAKKAEAKPKQVKVEIGSGAQAAKPKQVEATTAA